MSEEEKKAIEEIKKDEEYYDILHYIQENEYDMWNVEKLMRDSTNGNYTRYEIAESIVYFINQIEKQQKEIEHLNLCLESEDKAKAGLENDIKSLLHIEPNDNFIHKDKIRKLIKDINEETQYLGKDRGETKQYYAIQKLKELLKE